MKTRRILVVLLLTLFVFMVAPNGNVKADITFMSPPDAKIKYWPQSGYAPLIVTFENHSKRADEIKWTLWDYVIDEEQFDEGDNNIVYQYIYPGTFPVYLEATNEAGTDVAVVYVTVLDAGLPLAPVEFVAAPRNGPVGTEVQFINLTAGEFDKFLWDFGDNTSDTEEDPTHKYETAGVYTVSLTLFDATSGYVNTETKVNYINIFPASTSMRNPDFIADRATGTTPHMVQFSSLLGGETEDVLWDFGDGTSSELLNPKHIYKEPGRYTVTLSIDGEEVSKADYINSFEPFQGPTSPAILLLNGDEAQLIILQNFRDNVLGPTLPGRGLIELYYKHSLELVSILQADEELRATAAAVLTELLPGFQSVVDGDTMTLTPVQMDKIKAVIGGIAAQAAPELGEVLTQLIIELTDGQFLQSIGMSVSAAK